MIKEALQGTPLFIPARAIYRKFFQSRKRRAERRGMIAFYRQFFAEDDLVFDVGANRGEYSELFSHGGARVIAIEPNPGFRAQLDILSKAYKITPEFCAVGAEPGTAMLNVCSVPGYSTLMPTDGEIFKTSPDYHGVAWTHQVSVPVHTLDELAARHGMPSYVKIDVEGFEEQVLAGMSFSPRNISFEFRYLNKEAAFRCLDTLGARKYRFCPILDRHPVLKADQWLAASDAKAWLNKPADVQYGDMFARLDYPT